MKKNNIYAMIIGGFVIFIIILGIIITTNNNMQLNKVNNMYQDISKLEEKIDLYYLDNGILPILNKVDNINFSNINPNDNEEYYDLDLSKIPNMRLFYGYKEDGEDDKYIINNQSHTIYYKKGIKYKKNKIYTKMRDFKLIKLEKYQ